MSFIDFAELQHSKGASRKCVDSMHYVPSDNAPTQPPTSSWHYFKFVVILNLACEFVTTRKFVKTWYFLHLIVTSCLQIRFTRIRNYVTLSIGIIHIEQRLSSYVI